MLLSIILPIYNVSAYLGQCLDSILCTQRDDIEVILVDDGSVDSSGFICDQYAAKDKRCMVVHKKNGGLSDARNVGLKYATSEYVFLVDSDDYLMPNALDILLACVETNPNVDIIQFRYTKVWDDYIEKCSDTDSCELYYNEEAYKGYIQGKNFTRTTWDKIYKRNLFDGILYPVGYLAEDYGTTYKVLGRAKRLLFYDKVLYCYRQRKDSIMSQNKIKLILDEYELGKEFYTNNLERYPQYVMLANSEYINLLLKTNYRILIHPEGQEEDAKKVFVKAEQSLKIMKRVPCQVRTRIIQNIYFLCKPLFIQLMKLKFHN